MFSPEDLRKTYENSIQRDRRSLKKLKIETDNDLDVKRALEDRIEYMKEKRKRIMKNENE